MIKTFRLIISLTFILISAIFAVAQTEKPQSVALSKIAVIQVAAFEDEKRGITTLVELNKKLDEEFKPYLEELQMMMEKNRKLVREVSELAQTQCELDCPGKLEQIESKSRENEESVCEVRNIQEKVKSLFDKRKVKLTADITKKIADALKQFAKDKGYALVIDGSKIDNVFIDYNENFIDITDEFIKFYNESFGKIKSQ